MKISRNGQKSATSKQTLDEGTDRKREGGMTRDGNRCQLSAANGCSCSSKKKTASTGYVVDGE